MGRLTQRPAASFPSPPAALNLRADLAAGGPIYVSAWRAEPALSNGVVQLVGEPEIALIDVAHPRATLFVAAAGSGDSATDADPAVGPPVEPGSGASSSFALRTGSAWGAAAAVVVGVAGFLLGLLVVARRQQRE